MFNHDCRCLRLQMKDLVFKSVMQYTGAKSQMNLVNSSNYTEAAFSADLCFYWVVFFFFQLSVKLFSFDFYCNLILNQRHLIYRLLLKRQK